MTDLAGATALVTGASGAVGSAVVRRLQREGCRVRGMARGARPLDLPEGAAWIRADLSDRDGLREAARGADLAVHCAASRSGDRQEAERVNVGGTEVLVDALVEAGCRRLVHVSTLSVYDDAAGPEIDEDAPLKTSPEDTYGSTKAASERVVLAAAGRGVGAVILRPGMVLSMHPRSRWGPLAFERARASAASILPFPEVPFVHVASLADAIVRAARTPAACGRAYNALEGAGDGAEYLAIIYGALGRSPPPIPSDAPRVRYRAERIRRELGWSPGSRWGEFLGELRAARAAR